MVCMTQTLGSEMKQVELHQNNKLLISMVREFPWEVPALKGKKIFLITEKKTLITDFVSIMLVGSLLPVTILITGLST